MIRIQQNLESIWQWIHSRHQKLYYTIRTNTKRSRALAVAAHEGNFSIYSLKPMSQLKKDLNDGLESRGAFPNHFDPTSSVSILLEQT